MVGDGDGVETAVAVETGVGGKTAASGWQTARRMMKVSAVPKLNFRKKLFMFAQPRLPQYPDTSFHFMSKQVGHT
jgi:hypothetical protein